MTGKKGKSQVAEKMVQNKRKTHLYASRKWRKKMVKVEKKKEKERGKKKRKKWTWRTLIILYYVYYENGVIKCQASNININIFSRRESAFLPSSRF